MNAPITHINCLGVHFSIARTHIYTHLLHKNCFRILCSHVGPHSILLVVVTIGLEMPKLRGGRQAGKCLWSRRTAA